MKIDLISCLGKTPNQLTSFERTAKDTVFIYVTFEFIDISELNRLYAVWKSSVARSLKITFDNNYGQLIITDQFLGILGFKL